MTSWCQNSKISCLLHNFGDISHHVDISSSIDGQILWYLHIILYRWPSPFSLSVFKFRRERKKANFSFFTILGKIESETSKQTEKGNLTISAWYLLHIQYVLRRGSIKKYGRCCPVHTGDPSIYTWDPSIHTKDPSFHTWDPSVLTWVQFQFS
jgi:hypothetical protein